MVEIFPGEVIRFRVFAVVMATSNLDSTERFLNSKSRAKKSLGKAKIMWSVVHTVFIVEWSRHLRKCDSVAGYTLSKPGFECNIAWITGWLQPELQSLYGQKSERWKAEPVLFVFEMKLARMTEETVSKLKRSRQMFQVSYNSFYFILSYWCHTNTLNVSRPYWPWNTRTRGFHVRNFWPCLAHTSDMRKFECKHVCVDLRFKVGNWKPFYVLPSLPSRPLFTVLCTVLGRVVRKPISANPGLKVNREFNFFYIKVFWLFMFCEDWDWLTSKLEKENINRKPHWKCKKLKPKFTLILD